MTRAAEAPRVFIDSSVFFAACLSPTGGARELLLRGLRGDVSLVVSRFVLQETRRNLQSKAPSVLPLLDAFLDLSFLGVGPEPDDAKLHRAEEIVDPKDAPIVAAALTADTTFLATHDTRHLLSHADEIRDAFGIEVVTPGDLLQSFDSASS